MCRGTGGVFDDELRRWRVEVRANDKTASLNISTSATTYMQICRGNLGKNLKLPPPDW
ncbi:hypothetical protein Pan181_11590 [Aeoliella mucimassa]|uniref:Uncharacterized protein n=1 Tax=Aeoliella mucimassa TaxID=2527972 RepID=A0A518AJX1_9BACT|nr:hypothetical protein Pan181_11590 [Aeoliella mucimassa]